MALKGDRVILETDITLVNNSTTERGVALLYQTSGSGVNVGDVAGSTALYAGVPSGSICAGILLNDQVTIDETRYHRNFHKDEMKVGERCTLLRKGRVTTNMLVPGITLKIGDKAYVGPSGLLTNVIDPSGALTCSPPVGRFAGLKDENNYACVDVNLPLQF